MAMKFYNNLKEESSGEDVSPDNSNNIDCAYNDDSSLSTEITDISTSNTSINTLSSTAKPTEDQQLQHYKQALCDIVDDIMDRLTDGDQNMLSWVTKFLKSYTYMQQSSIAPSPTISYALHNFGRPDSRLIFNKGFAGVWPYGLLRDFSM